MIKNFGLLFFRFTLFLLYKWSSIADRLLSNTDVFEWVVEVYMGVSEEGFYVMLSQ